MAGKQAQWGSVPKSVREACRPLRQYNSQLLKTESFTLPHMNTHMHKQETFILYLIFNSDQPIKETPQIKVSVFSAFSFYLH